jgi:hypothetical protein
LNNNGPELETSEQLLTRRLKVGLLFSWLKKPILAVYVLGKDWRRRRRRQV